jgi:hypothetical protein
LKGTFITPSGTTAVKVSSGANFALLLEIRMKNQLTRIRRMTHKYVEGQVRFSYDNQ